jgi:hypothetical protein
VSLSFSKSPGNVLFLPLPSIFNLYGPALAVCDGRIAHRCELHPLKTHRTVLPRAPVKAGARSSLIYALTRICS